MDWFHPCGVQSGQHAGQRNHSREWIPTASFWSKVSFSTCSYSAPQWRELIQLVTGTPNTASGRVLPLVGARNDIDVHFSRRDAQRSSSFSTARKDNVCERSSLLAASTSLQVTSMTLISEGPCPSCEYDRYTPLWKFQRTIGCTTTVFPREPVLPLGFRNAFVGHWYSSTIHVLHVSSQSCFAANFVSILNRVQVLNASGLPATFPRQFTYFTVDIRDK